MASTTATGNVYRKCGEICNSGYSDTQPNRLTDMLITILCTLNWYEVNISTYLVTHTSTKQQNTYMGPAPCAARW